MDADRPGPAAGLRDLAGYADGGAELRDHVFRRTRRELRRWHEVNDRLATPDDVERRRTEIRAAAADLLGPRRDEPAPAVEVRGTVRRPAYAIEKLIIEAAPGHAITGNLYRPDRRPERTGAVLVLCGHAAEGKAYPPYQALAARLARNGLIALVIDPFGQGERRQFPDRDDLAQPTSDHTLAGVRCWWSGRSSGRYFVRDTYRAIDHLAARPDVDPARIGITGNSGGGTQTTFAMMLDDRIAAAAPATFLTSRGAYLAGGQAQDAEQVLLGGTTAGLDHEDALIAMAPRPVLVLAADYDFFPIEGTIASVERARRSYRILGRPEALTLHRARTPHEYAPELARAATEFFVTRLHPEPGSVDHTAPEPLPAAALACTSTGQLLTDGTHPVMITDLNAAEPPPVRDGIGWLADRVHAGRRPAAEHYPRWFPAEDHRLGEVAVITRRVFWRAETDLSNAALLITPRGRFESLTLAILDRGTADLDRYSDRLATMIDSGRAVLALDVRGSGSLAPHPISRRDPDETFGTCYRLTCDLFWLGDSLAAGQVHDVLRCLELITTDPELDLAGRPIDLWGAGLGAFLGGLAAALHRPAFRTVDLTDPPADPAAIVRGRDADDATSWRHLIPGLAGAVDLPSLLRWVQRPVITESTIEESRTP